MPQAKLTQSFVSKATCPENRRKITYSCTRTRGLVLELRASGGRTFYYRYHDDRGRQKNVKLGDASVVSVQAARKRVEHLASQRVQGHDPANERDESRQTPTLSTFVHDMFLPYVRSYKRAPETDASVLNTHILPRFGQARMNEITHYQLVCFAREKRDSGLAAGSVNRMLTILRYLFNMALEWEVPGLHANPARRIKFFPDTHRERFVTADELQALLKALRTSSNPDLVNIVSLLVLTGARRGEALSARWENIDLERQLWTIPLSKSGKTRHVPLNDGAVRLLAGLPSRGQSPYVFPSRRTGRPYKQIHEQWDRARKLAGLEDVRMHDLRHSFASFLVNAGHSLYEVQKLLGHHSISVTQRYAHLTDERLAHAASAADVVPTPTGKEAARLDTDGGPADVTMPGEG